MCAWSRYDVVHYSLYSRGVNIYIYIYWCKCVSVCARLADKATDSEEQELSLSELCTIIQNVREPLNRTKCSSPSVFIWF